MAGLNTTGKTNTQHYNLGRGQIFAALLDANDRPEAYEFLGNAPAFAVNVESENFVHFNSQDGLKFADLDIEVQKTIGITVTLDEMSQQNLARSFSGDVADYTNPSKAGFASHQILADGKLKKGTYLALVDSAGFRAYDVQATDITLETTNGTPVPLVEGTDYDLYNSEMGFIFIRTDSSVVDTAITNGEGLTLALTARAGASDVTEVQGATGPSKKIALVFIGKNPVNNNEQYELTFYKTRLKSEGEVGFINDEVTTMQFTGSAEVNSNAPGTSKVFSHRDVTAPSAA